MTYTTLVSTAELAAHLDDANWVILDCQHDLMNPAFGRDSYAREHIPGARFISIDDDLAEHPPATGPKLRGRHPLQTSDALGAAAVQIGPDAVATAAVLNKQLGLSFGKVSAFFAERFGLQVVPSAIVRALHRAATAALPTYAALVQTVRTSPMVVADETGWRVHAELQWLWACVTPTTTVYVVLPGRGFDEAACLLGASLLQPRAGPR